MSRSLSAYAKMRSFANLAFSCIVSLAAEQAHLSKEIDSSREDIKRRARELQQLAPDTSLDPHTYQLIMRAGAGAGAKQGAGAGGGPATASSPSSSASSASASSVAAASSSR